MITYLKGRGEKMYKWLKLLTILTLILSFSNNSLEAFNIPLIVKERVGVPRINEPVTCGIPFPKGILSSDQAVSLSGGTALAQFKSLANWDDGSVKWLLVDFQADVTQEEQKIYYLTDGAGNTPDSELKVTEFATNTTVITGPMKFIISKEHFNLFDGVWIDKNNNKSFEDSEKIVEPDRLDNNIIISDCLIGGPIDGLYGNYPGTFSSSLIAPKEVEIEEEGPTRVVIKIKGGYKKYDETILPEYIAYTIRIHAYAGKDYLKVFYTLENNGLYKDHAESLKEEWLYFDELSMNLNLKTGANKDISTDNYTETYNNNEIFYLYQGHQIIDEKDESKNFFYTIKKNDIQVGNGSRTTGWVDINDGNFGVTVCIKNFWQNYDKSISFSNNKLSLGLWPKEDYWPHNSTGQQAGNYQFEGGRYKTYEIFYRFYSGSKDLVKTQNLIKAFNTPLFGLAPSNWYVDSEALGMIAPAGLTHDTPEINEALARFEQLQRCKIHLEDSEWQDDIPPLTIYTQRENRSTTYVNYNIDWYGWFSFGDLPWYDGWCSLHYDWPYSMLLHFIRTQDYGFFDLGLEMCRHRYDIDQYQSIGNESNSLWFGYWQRYEKGEHGDLREYPYREYTPKPTHTWNNGLILDYLLTGDKRALEAALKNGQAVINYWRKIYQVEQTNVEHYEIRNQGWSILNLINLYRVTGNNDYLNLAKSIAKNSLLWMEVKRGKRGYWGYSEPDTTTQYMNLYSYVIDPLIELHYLTKDEELKELLLRMANWLKGYGLSGGYSVEIQYMPFQTPMTWIEGSNNTNGEVIYDFFFTNLFAYCYLLTNDDEYLNLARQLFRDGTFYWQEPGGTLLNSTQRSKINYHPRKYPNSETKIHGWTGRTNQVYLWTEYQLQAGTQSTLTKIVVNPDNIHLKANTSCEFTAIGYDQYNNQIPNLVFTWQIIGEIGTLSITTATATIFTADTTPGSGSIIASYGLINASAEIIVTPGTPSTITLFSGDNQSGVINTTLALPLVVIVTDEYNNPISNVNVEFKIKATPVNANGQTLSVTSSITDTQGNALTYLTLGDIPGTYRVTAVNETLSGSPIEFTAVANQTNLMIDPEITQEIKNATFTLAIKIIGIKALIGAQIYLKFDRQYLEVQDSNSGNTGIQISKGPFLPENVSIIKNDVNNLVGTIEYIFVIPPQNEPLSGSGDIAYITFLAKDVGTSTIYFSLETLYQTKMVSTYGDIPFVISNGTITILPLGDIEGYALLDIPHRINNINTHRDIEITVVESNQKVFTDDIGYFIIKNLSPQTYTLTAKIPGASSATWTNVVVTSNMIIRLATRTLLNGDANSDGVVDILDYPIYYLAFGSTWGDNNWDPRADWTGDSIIDILDYPIFYVNFGKVASKSRALSKSTQKLILPIELSILPSVKIVEVGENFILQVKLSGNNFIGGQCYIKFDPQKLELVDCKPNTPGIQISAGNFPPLNDIFIINQDGDNIKGEIRFCFGLDPTIINSISGSGELALIPFVAKKSGDTKITFDVRDTKFVNREGDVFNLIYGESNIMVNGKSFNEMTIAYPNPAKEKVSFIGLTTNSRIKVFNIAGELVWEEKSLSGEDKYWDVKDEKVASGIYIYIITNDRGDIKKGKLGIVK